MEEFEPSVYIETYQEHGKTVTMKIRFLNRPSSRALENYANTIKEMMSEDNKQTVN